ncbi:MAG: hypothetical protein KGZ25_09275, partial [Planctomycetes bacterium]|nr:hypothetical protein [Planctomycetota bacterium]
RKKNIGISGQMYINDMGGFHPPIVNADDSQDSEASVGGTCEYWAAPAVQYDWMDHFIAGGYMSKTLNRCAGADAQHRYAGALSPYTGEYFLGGDTEDEDREIGKGSNWIQYAANGMIMDNNGSLGVGRKPWMVRKIQRMSKGMWVMCNMIIGPQADWRPWFTWTDGSGGRERHNNYTSYNALFFDGHAKTVNPWQYPVFEAPGTYNPDRPSEAILLGNDCLYFWWPWY